MAAKHTKRGAKSAAESRRESGLPGGGQGRIDDVGRTGVYPGSGPYPSGPAELRTPAEFVRGQTDAEGRPVEGGSELIYFEGRTLLGGATPPASGPPGAPGPQASERPASPGKPRGAKPRRRRGRSGADRGEDQTGATTTRKSARRAKKGPS